MIIPAILVNNFEDFASQTKKIAGIFEMAQIDIMDGEFVPNQSFAEIEKINELNLPLAWELHLMVTHPLRELEKWTEVKNIKRVIFHIESADNPQEVINFLRGKCWGAGLAINPETPTEKIAPYVNLVDEILFMTVHPGAQGAPFLPEVGDKIRNFIELNSDQRPIIAVDGGINENNIALVKSWGVDTFCVGSALVRSENILQTYEQLKKYV